MKPQIAEMWDFALTKLKNAERYLNTAEDELAKSEAKDAVAAGLPSIKLLLQEDYQHTFNVALDHTFEDEDPFSGCSCPRDYVAKARELLKSYANLSPPENKLWGM